MKYRCAQCAEPKNDSGVWVTYEFGDGPFKCKICKACHNEHKEIKGQVGIRLYAHQKFTLQKIGNGSVQRGIEKLIEGARKHLK